MVFELIDDSFVGIHKGVVLAIVKGFGEDGIAVLVILVPKLDCTEK